MIKSFEEVVQVMDNKVGIEMNRASSRLGGQRRLLREDDI